MKKIRVLNFSEANNGNFLINWVINQLFSTQFTEYETKFLEYGPLNRQLSEILRMLKPHPGAPFFNFHRYKVISKEAKRVIPREFSNKLSMEHYLKEQKFDLVVASKPTWDITNQWALKGFPSIFWLPMDLPSKKVAFGVSGHRSLPSLVAKHQNTIRTILDSYSLVGIRDDWTYEIVSSSKTSTPIRKIPDPVFAYEFIDSNIKTILQEKGVDLKRPMVAFAVYGRDEIFKELADHFRKEGFQILGISMFNPNVDINLGDTLNPFEWADLFRLLSFCITDRFHATILALLANTPFISIEPYPAADIRNSKIYDLLKSVNLLESYVDVYKHNFQTAEIIEKAESLRKGWAENHSTSVFNTVSEKKAQVKQFVTEIQSVLD